VEIQKSWKLRKWIGEDRIFQILHIYPIESTRKNSKRIKVNKMEWKNLGIDQILGANREFNGTQRKTNG